MNLEDILSPPQSITTEKWQLGSIVTHEIPENGIVLVFVSDFRGAQAGDQFYDYATVRDCLYRLSKLDFEVQIADLGNLISGKTLQDTHYAIQEIVSSCLYKNSIPIIIGGGNDLSYSLFYTLNFHQKNNHYTHISSEVSLSAEGEEISEKNFLTKLFSAKNFSLKDFHFLGYQKHLNEVDSVHLIEEVEFDIIRLVEMMGSTENMEPFFRRADLVTLDCNAVESIGEGFSIRSQVNGLNKREICNYTKEIGLGEKLKTVGIFNFNAGSTNPLHHQLLAQMIWYLIEGINIQKTHPKERTYETFTVLLGEKDYPFVRDTFSNLWYYGNDEDIEKCIPCSRQDYENAKRGIINLRLLKINE